MKVIYKKYDSLEESNHFIGRIRDTIVDGYNAKIPDHNYHSMAEYVGYNLFSLFVEEGHIDCESHKQETVSDLLRKEN